ncbi:MAG: DUF2167 domain-containing protein [Myxococcota bacterium]
MHTTSFVRTTIMATSILGIAAWASPSMAEPAPGEGEAPSEDVAGGGEAQDAPESPEAFFDANFEWKKEGSGVLGTRAELDIPAGYRFGASETATNVLRAMGNIPDGTELGLIGPSDLDWFVIYDFEDIGYVKDDDKDDLDADEMLKQFREMASQSNEVRRERGLATYTITRWAIPPRYDETTHVLEWATEAEFTDPDTGEKNTSVNYRTKVLGRRGVMNVVVVCGPDELDDTLVKYQNMMQGFRYTEGERYAEYKPGDKIAQYGLAALVVGGATAVAAKTGLLAGLLLFLKKGAKFVVLALAAAAAAVGSFVKRLFGGGKQAD